MKTWKNRKSGALAQTEDHQFMIAGWELVTEETPQGDSPTENSFQTYKELRTQAHQHLPAYLRGIEYRFSGTSWKKVPQNG